MVGLWYGWTHTYLLGHADALRRRQPLALSLAQQHLARPQLGRRHHVVLAVLGALGGLVLARLVAHVRLRVCGVCVVLFLCQ